MSNAGSSGDLYFGYGSNMWREQMLLRCPDSVFIGIGRLDGFKWIINERGYANVVPSSPNSDCVWGMIYTLTTSDWQALDRNEGVPDVYGKETRSARFWHMEHGRKTEGMGEMKGVVVYIDYQRATPSEPKEEYVFRMNEGIKDAVAAGVPVDYVGQIIRRFIPESADLDGERKELAQKQARHFEDE